MRRLLSIVNVFSGWLPSTSSFAGWLLNVNSSLGRLLSKMNSFLDVPPTRLTFDSKPDSVKSLSNITLNHVYRTPGNFNQINILFLTHGKTLGRRWSSRYSCRYHSGTWRNESRSFVFTEKTNVMIAAAVTRDADTSRQELFREVAKDYTITKLMLLREIALQYLKYDVLVVLFEHTE